MGLALTDQFLFVHDGLSIHQLGDTDFGQGTLVEEVEAIPSRSVPRLTYVS